MALESSKSTNVAVEALAGFTAGLMATTLLHPIDTIKVRLQAGPSQGLELFRHPSLTIAKRVFQDEGGIRALYRGITPNVVGNSASWALYFIWYDFIKTTLKAANRPETALSYRDYMTASALSSAATAVITNPIWVIKTRMLTTSRKAYHSTTVTKCIQNIYERHGLRGFYTGLTPSLFGTLTFSIQFTLYEKLKRWKGTKHDHRLNSLDYITFSALSKLIASTSTYPYQVLRARMQSYSPTSEVRRLRSVITEIWCVGGIRGYYRGIGPSMLRVVPSTCITFLVYEQGRRFYGMLLDKRHLYHANKILA